MRTVALQQGWTETDIARLVLAFLARRGEIDAFETYLVRAAKNNSEGPRK